MKLIYKKTNTDKDQQHFSQILRKWNYFEFINKLSFHTITFI